MTVSWRRNVAGASKDATLDHFTAVAMSRTSDDARFPLCGRLLMQRQPLVLPLQYGAGR